MSNVKALLQQKWNE